MAERVQKQKQARKKEQAAVEEVKSKDASELKREMDALLDEIDEVLEENAEEFVRSYQQKGGE